LTECTHFSKNDSLIIRTLVPIKPLKSNFSLIELQPIPFTFKFNASSLTNVVCGMNEVRGIYAVDSDYIVKSDCKPGSSELCFVKQSDHHWVDPCLLSIFSNSSVSEGMSAECNRKTTCQNMPTKKFPLFSRLSSDILAIVGYSVEKIEIFISCSGNPYKVIKPNETGVLLVQLSCDCKIVYKFQEFHAQQPCHISDMKIQHVNFSSLSLFLAEKMQLVGNSVNLNKNSITGQQIGSTITGEQKDDDWLLYLAVVFGFFGFLAFMWLIVDAVKSRLTAMLPANSDNNSENFASVAYTANNRKRGSDPMAYLVQKEQNLL
jgi:hypothetical protein